MALWANVRVQQSILTLLSEYTKNLNLQLRTREDLRERVRGQQTVSMGDAIGFLLRAVKRKNRKRKERLWNQAVTTPQAAQLADDVPTDRG